MARLAQSGAELGSIADEIDQVSGTGATVVTTAGKVRTGTYSYRIAPAASAVSLRLNLKSAVQSNRIWVRGYVLFDTLPGATVNLFGFLDTANAGNKRCSIAVTSAGTLVVLKTDQTQLGSPSSALSTGRWYRIEITMDETTNPGTVEARFTDCGTSGTDPGTTGTVIAAGNDSGTGTNTFAAMAFGLYTTNSSAVCYFDDIAANDASGSSQNTWCGAGKIIHLHPAATGDSNTFPVQVGGTSGSANNWTRVNEVPPNDATSYNASAVLNASDLFAVGSSGIGALDTINTLCVGGRIADLVGADATAAVKVQVEKTSGGTKAMSTSLAPNTVTWTTNPKQAGFSCYPLTTYLDPDGGAWTAATLASMQIGYLQSVINLQAVGVTNVWASVDYNPLVQILVSLAGAGALSATVTPYQRVAPQLAGVGALSAAVTPYKRFTAAMAGAGSLAASMTLYQRFAASLTGTGALNAALTPYQRFVASLAGAGVLGVTVTEYQRLIALLGGEGALAALLTVIPTPTPTPTVVAGVGGSGFPADWLAKRLAQGQPLDDPLLSEIAELVALGLL